MTEFDPAKFEEKYVHYFEELEAAYSSAYTELHGTVDSRLLQASDRRILAESEPVYEGDGRFRVVLPDDVEARIRDAPGDDEALREVLERLTDAIERELARTFFAESRDDTRQTE